ncbi:hypothetical protein V2G26_000916 [Clonostachys chloroleuca]
MSQTACSEWTVSGGQADWGSAESEGTLARVQCSNGDDGKRSHDDEEKEGSVDANALIIPLVYAHTCMKHPSHPKAHQTCCLLMISLQVGAAGAVEACVHFRSM